MYTKALVEVIGRYTSTKHLPLTPHTIVLSDNLSFKLKQKNTFILKNFVKAVNHWNVNAVTSLDAWSFQYRLEKEMFPFREMFEDYYT